MSSGTLTERQRKVLDFVQAYVGGHGFPPTLREIGDAVGIASLNAVRGHLAALEKKGWIVKSPDKARSIQILDRKKPEPSAVSRFKRALHELLRTDEGVVHRLVYGAAWVTLGRGKVLSDEAAEAVSAALDEEAVERGWKLHWKNIELDCIMVVVEAWPNHAPDKIVRRLQQAAGAAVRRALRLTAKSNVWGDGYVVTTEPESIEGLVKDFSRVEQLVDREDGHES